MIGIGNTCYQNSFLQSLYLTKELRQRVLAAPLVPHARWDIKKKDNPTGAAGTGDKKEKENKMDEKEKERYTAHHSNATSAHVCDNNHMVCYVCVIL